LKVKEKMEKILKEFNFSNKVPIICEVTEYLSCRGQQGVPKDLSYSWICLDWRIKKLRPTMLHEIGHHVWYFELTETERIIWECEYHRRVKKANESKQWKRYFASKYAMTDKYEFFACSFADYVSAKRNMLSINGVVLKSLQDITSRIKG
jgi:hypothetical protein